MRFAIKIGIGSIIGIGLGIGGYFLWRHIKMVKHEKEMNEPIEVEYFKDNSQKDTDILRDDDDPVSNKTDIDKAKFADSLKSYMSHNDKDKDFESYLSEMESPEDDDEDYEDDIPENGSSKPYPITAGDFCNTRTYYDKVSLNYFVEDDVVSDDRDRVFDDAYYILGDLRSYAKTNSMIYIRNEKLEVDYEITVINSSYRKDVLNLNEEV